LVIDRSNGPGRTEFGPPAVSVVLPTYNRADTLKRSIQSVLSQSFTDFELIVVDDASRDESAEVVASFDDSRIKYVRNEFNLGGAGARNVGIRNARANLIAFQDSDDEWLPIKLERCLEELNKDDSLLGVYSAYWQIMGRNARYLPMICPPDWGEDMTEALLWGNFVGTPTAVVYKDALNKCGGFDQKMPRYQDWELFIRLSAHGKFLFIEEPLILSYCTSNSITSNHLAHQHALERIYKKNFEKIKQNKRLLASWHARIGDAQMRTGSPMKGRKNLFKAFTLAPLNLRIAIKMFFSSLGNRFFYVYMTKFFQKKWI
jgi:glycosyltransferase involved in cell wall biosynthesis